MSVIMKSLRKFHNRSVSIDFNIWGKIVQNNLGRSEKLKIVNEEVGWVGETCDRQTNEMVTTAQSLPFSPLRDLICWATRIN